MIRLTKACLRRVFARQRRCKAAWRRERREARADEIRRRAALATMEAHPWEPALDGIPPPEE